MGMLRMRSLSAGFIAPCLPTKTDKLPSGSQWFHEIKHDGFRIIARTTGAQVRLYSRPGNDLTHRFPLIAETLARLRSRSCIIDGEAVACDDNGVASFNLIRYRRHDDSTFLYAFDPDRTERRRSAARCVRGSQGHARIYRGQGQPRAFGSMSIPRATARPSSPTPARWRSKASCRKRRDSHYRSGRSPDWLKMKNANAPAVKREEEEDWGRPATR